MTEHTLEELCGWFKNISGFERAIIALVEDARKTNNLSRLENSKLYCRQCKKILPLEIKEHHVSFGCNHFFWGFSK